MYVLSAVAGGHSYDTDYASHSGVSMAVVLGFPSPLPKFLLRPSNVLTKPLDQLEKNAIPRQSVLREHNHVQTHDPAGSLALLEGEPVVSLLVKNKDWHIDSIGDAISVHSEREFALGRDLPRLANEALHLAQVFRERQRAMAEGG